MKFKECEKVIMYGQGSGGSPVVWVCPRATAKGSGLVCDRSDAPHICPPRSLATMMRMRRRRRMVMKMKTLHPHHTHCYCYPHLHYYPHLEVIQQVTLI